MADLKKIITLHVDGSTDVQLLTLDTAGLTTTEIGGKIATYKTSLSPSVVEVVDMESAIPHPLWWRIKWYLDHARLSEETRNGVKVIIITVTND